MRILFFDLCTVLYTILCNNPLKHSSTARMLTKRSYRCRLRPAQLQEKTIEKNKKERTKRRHESTATTTTVVPPLRHRCAILTTNAASYLRMQMLGSVAKSIKHSTWASTLNFSPAWCRYLDLFPYSNVFNFFFLFLISDMPWLYFMATTTGYTDKTIKRGHIQKVSNGSHHANNSKSSLTCSILQEWPPMDVPHSISFSKCWCDRQGWIANCLLLFFCCCCSNWIDWAMHRSFRQKLGCPLSFVCRSLLCWTWKAERIETIKINQQTIKQTSWTTILKT